MSNPAVCFSPAARSVVVLTAARSSRPYHAASRRPVRIATANQGARIGAFPLCRGVSLSTRFRASQGLGAGVPQRFAERYVMPNRNAAPLSPDAKDIRLTRRKPRGTGLTQGAACGTHRNFLRKLP
jgi:hypothetical protein